MPTRAWRGLVAALIGGALLASEPGRAGEPPLMRDVELEALEQAVRWPNPDIGSVFALLGRFVASGRDDEGYAYFRERASNVPERPLFLALEGFFQARMAGEVFL